jgi:hypothetical protein
MIHTESGSKPAAKTAKTIGNQPVTFTFQIVEKVSADLAKGQIDACRHKNFVSGRQPERRFL